MTEPELLTAPEVAALLNCSSRHLHRMRLRGMIVQPILLGGAVRWRRSDVMEWIAKQPTTAPSRVRLPRFDA